MKRSDYSPDWQDIIRPAILKRDAYKCQHCGINHKQLVYKNSTGYVIVDSEFTRIWCMASNIKTFKIYLTVAHLDQNKMNNDPINLLSLCPKCHSKYDSSSRVLKRIMYKKKVSESNPTNLDFKGDFINKSAGALKIILRENYSIRLTIDDCRDILTRLF